MNWILSFLSIYSILKDFQLKEQDVKIKASKSILCTIKDKHLVPSLEICMQKLWAWLLKNFIQISLFYFRLHKCQIEVFCPMASFTSSETHIFVKKW